VARDRIQAQIRLTPVIEVFPEVLAFIKIAEYLVNGLRAARCGDPARRAAPELRSVGVSTGLLAAGAAAGPLSLDRWSAIAGWFAVAVLTPTAWLTIRRRIAVV
jgi:hypothetical protein